MTADEINDLRLRAHEESRPLLLELKPLARGELIDRLMKEPLLQRLYWHHVFTTDFRTAKAERKRLTEGVTDDELVDAQIVLAKGRQAASRAAHRHYGYPGYEPGSKEEIMTELIEKAGECPLTIVFHTYNQMLLELR